MAYAGYADLVVRAHGNNVLAWCDDDADGVLSDAELAFVTEAIADADAEIDARLRGVYGVPFDPVPQLILKISCDIAIYHLAMRRGFRVADGEMTNVYVVAYRHALSLLDMLAAGTMSLADAGAAPTVQVTHGDAEPTFSREAVDRVTGDTIDEDLDGTLDTW